MRNDNCRTGAAHKICQLPPGMPLAYNLLESAALGVSPSFTIHTRRSPCGRSRCTWPTWLRNSAAVTLLSPHTVWLTFILCSAVVGSFCRQRRQPGYDVLACSFCKHTPAWLEKHNRRAFPCGSFGPSFTTCGTSWIALEPYVSIRGFTLAAAVKTYLASISEWPRAAIRGRVAAASLRTG